jgi:hypothetical protein
VVNAEQFNARYPVGTLVFAYPGARPEDIPSARRLVTRTRTEAQASCSGDPVVWVEGEGSYISLTHVDPVSKGEWERARTADAVAELGALPMPMGDEPQRESTVSVRKKVADLLWWSVPSGTDEEAKARTQELLDAHAAEVRTATLTEVIDLVEGFAAGAVERDVLRDLATELRARMTKGNSEDGALRDRITELEALLAAATEFRVWEPGYGLYVRRAPGGQGFAVLEARRTGRGRRAWTTAGWHDSTVLSNPDLYCWPDAASAVAEARRIMPGAVVDDGTDGITRRIAPTQTLRVTAPDTFPAWLRQRYTATYVDWDHADDADRSYWEHGAAAVRRAVARGGFKTPAASTGECTCDDGPGDWCVGCSKCSCEPVHSKGCMYEAGGPR